MTFLAVLSSPLPSSHVVYAVFFLNSATKNNFRDATALSWAHYELDPEFANSFAPESESKFCY